MTVERSRGVRRRVHSVSAPGSASHFGAWAFSAVALVLSGSASAQTDLPPSISEESGRNSRMCPNGRQVIYGVRCSGSFCDNVHLACTTVGNLFPTNWPAPVTYTPWVEADDIRDALCGNGSFAVGMECRGGNCDDVRLICKDSGYAHTGCYWSGWYSEENGWFEDGSSGLAGVQCSGRHCDNKRYYMCKRTPALRPDELQVTLHTGGDNLRGGNDNLAIGVIVDGQVRHWFHNVNGGREWKNNSTYTVTLAENGWFRVADVDGLTLKTTQQGSFGEHPDNWNLDWVQITHLASGMPTTLYTSDPGMVHRFTGELPDHTLYWRGNFLQVTIWTGADNLRGNGDNAHLWIIYASGERQRFENVNRNGTWQDDLPQTVYLPLPEAYSSITRLAEVAGVFVETTVRGGFHDVLASGDNWSINRVRVVGHVGRSRQTLYDQGSRPLVRITGEKRQHLLAWRPTGYSGRVLTSFRPEWNGLNFDNAFKESYFLSIVQNKGLCGGMSYTALDYFYAGLIPALQSFPPAPGSVLREYLYARQEMSLTGGPLDNWTELQFDPFGWRNNEIFRWGLQFGSGRLGELIDNINDNRPVPLGLRSCGASCGSDHQVVAYGYELGQYFGDLDGSERGIRIYVYDPNEPNEEVYLTPDRARNRWVKYVRGSAAREWLAYFVDEDYFGARRTPPSVSSPDKVLLLELTTGSDDLRRTDLGHGGGSFDVVLRTRTGLSHRFFNAFGGSGEMELLSESKEVVPIDVSRLPVAFLSDLESVEIITAFSGGENWDLAALTVTRQVDWTQCSLSPPSTPSSPVRFTGSVRSRVYPMVPAHSCNVVKHFPVKDHPREVYIRPADGQGALHAEGGSVAGAPTSLHPCSSQDNYANCKWYLERGALGYRIRVSNHPGLFVRAQGAYPGAALALSTCGGIDSRCAWHLEPSQTRAGAFYLRSASGHGYLHSAGGTRFGATQTLHSCEKPNNYGNCQWEIRSADR